MGNVVPIPSDNSANFNHCTCLFELHKYTTCTNQCTFIAELGKNVIRGIQIDVYSKQNLKKKNVIQWPVYTYFQNLHYLDRNESQLQVN